MQTFGIFPNTFFWRGFWGDIFQFFMLIFPIDPPYGPKNGPQFHKCHQSVTNTDVDPKSGPFGPYFGSICCSMYTKYMLPNDARQLKSQPLLGPK